MAAVVSRLKVLACAGQEFLRGSSKFEEKEGDPYPTVEPAFLYMRIGAQMKETGIKLEAYELEPRTQKTEWNATSLKGNERATQRGKRIT